MAEATKSTVVRTVQEEAFTLTLTADEFWYLKGLISKQPYNDGDGASARIYEAMTEDLITNEVTPEPDTTIRVGDRVRVLRATFAEEQHGRVGTVLEVDGDFRADSDDRHPYRIDLDGGDAVFAAEVEHVGDAPFQRFYDHGGVTYALRAEYRDEIGDIWCFTGERDEDGVPLMTCRLDSSRCSDPAEYQDWPLHKVLSYFTLTRV